MSKVDLQNMVYDTREEELEAVLRVVLNVADSALSDDDTKIVEAMRLRQAITDARKILSSSHYQNGAVAILKKSIGLTEATRNEWLNERDAFLAEVAKRERDAWHKARIEEAQRIAHEYPEYVDDYSDADPGL